MTSDAPQDDSIASSVEMGTVTDDRANYEVEARTPISDAQFALPPADKGFQAWFTVFASFLSNGLIWGPMLSFGVMQEYYSSHEPFSSHSSGIAAVGTTATGLSYLTMPVYLWTFQRYPRWRKYSLWISLPAVTASLVGASFASTVPQLVVTQGIFYAISGNALVMPTVSYLNEWFVARRGLAIGISIAGDGVGGAVMPLLLQATLNHVGFRWTLRIVACIIVILASPLMFTLKPRLPISTAHSPSPIESSFLKKRLFWTLQAANTIQALGYFLPINYLPSIAEALGLSPTIGSLTVLCINLAMVFGCIGVGALVDRIDVSTVMLGISVFSAVAIFTILGFTSSTALLFVFSILYGCSACAFSTNWGGMIREIQKKHEGVDAGVLFGLLAAGRGIGSIISGPLSEALVERSKSFTASSLSAYGSEYGPIIIFSGCTAMAGGFSWVMRRAKLI